MKICQYRVDSALGPIIRLGILLDDCVVDPNLVWACEFEREGFYNARERANFRCPSSLSQILKLNDDPLELLQTSYGLYLFLKKVGDVTLKDGTPISLSHGKYSLSRPIDELTSYRDFYTHELHVKKGFEKRKENVPEAWYEFPVFYKGSTAGFIGPNQEILWPNYTDVLDYELELAVLIGRDGKNIKEHQSSNHIFGLTILNDISARDIQRKEMSVRLGPSKGKDFCSIIGPVITTFDEFESENPNLLMTATINGEEWSRGYSGDAHFSWSQIIAHASKEEWLRAGDLLGSGTVGTGCGLELDRWIKPGDQIDLYIENIGHLVNRVGRKSGNI